MNQASLIDAVAATLECTKKVAEKVVQTVVSEMKKGLADEGEVKLSGFGVFTVKERAARTARNPKTGETVDVPAKKAPAFKAAKALKDELNA